MLSGKDEAAIDALANELGDFIESAPPKPYDGSGEFVLYCPVHETPETSKKASASWNPIATSPKFKYGVIHCYKDECNLADNMEVAIETWRVRTGKSKSKSTQIDWNNVKRVRGKAKAETEPSAENYRDYADLLLTDEERLEWLKVNRGLTLETLREYEWGWHPGKGAYIYPVYNLDNAIYGGRLYDPFHPNTDKKRWLKTATAHTNQLWGVKQADAIGARSILFEGETDTMFAHQDGFRDAVTQTGGAGVWKSEWNEYFRDKVVYICYDPDSAGRVGRDKVARELGDMPMTIKYIDLPDGLDYSSFRMAGGSVEAFEMLIDQAEEKHRRDIPSHMPHDGKKLKSIASLKDVDAAKVWELQAYISSKNDESHMIPKSMDISCKRNKGKKCENCPLGNYEPGQTINVEVRPDKDDIAVGLKDLEEVKQRVKVQKFAGLNCSDIDFVSVETWHVETLFVQDPVDSTNPLTVDTSNVIFNYYNKDNCVNASHQYRLVGRRMSDPHDSKLRFVSWVADKVDSELEKFIVTPSVKERLKSVRPKYESLESLSKALERRYNDLSANVTFIYGRSNLHLMYDLMMHSAIGFNFHEHPIDKGWLDVIVIGDTRTGKTNVVKRLNRHYRCGHLAAAGSTSFAGLVGGSAVATNAGKRAPDWGVLPRHNMRAVQIDEAGKMSELLHQMSSVRTSGIAEIIKQGGGTASAKVRLMWMTNPLPSDGSKRNIPISAINGGAITALANMAGQQEDVARFDIAMATAVEDVTAQESMSERSAANKYTSDLCHELVMFAWSRHPEHITFADGVEKYIDERTIEISGIYSQVPPLVQPSNFNTKLARLSVALATLMYSASEDGDSIIVKKVHVDYIEQFIHECYDTPLFGYGRASRRDKGVRRKAMESVASVKDYLLGKSKPVIGIADGRDVLRALQSMEGDEVNSSRLGSIVGGGAEQGERIISYFCDCGMMTRSTKGSHMSAELIRIVQELEEPEQ